MPKPPQDAERLSIDTSKLDAALKPHGFKTVGIFLRSGHDLAYIAYFMRVGKVLRDCQGHDLATVNMMQTELSAKVMKDFVNAEPEFMKLFVSKLLHVLHKTESGV